MHDNKNDPSESRIVLARIESRINATMPNLATRSDILQMFSDHVKNYHRSIPVSTIASTIAAGMLALWMIFRNLL